MSMTQDYDAEIASRIVARFEARPEMLIQILHGIVERFGHVPEAAIRQLAHELNLSRADVHGVVSYYHDFRTEPPGRHVVKICQAEACQAMGSRALTAHARATLRVDLDAASEDVSLDSIFCLGNCACSPAVMIDGRVYGRVTHERFDALVSELEGDG